MSERTTGPEADARRTALIAKVQKHNGEELSPRTDAAPAEDGEWKSPFKDRSTPSAGADAWPLIVASLWAVFATIVGLVFIFGVNGEAYGGDAYTGIESAIVTAVHAVGLVIISMGVLGLIIAGSRRV
jgi:hypothetical protein